MSARGRPWPGSWPPTNNGNTSRGRTVDFESRNNILVGDGVLIAAIGVNDLVVVATPDAVLVVPRSDAQRVKEVVEALQGTRLGRCAVTTRGTRREDADRLR